MTPNPSRLRMACAGAFFLFLFFLVVVRAVQLTVVQGDSLKLLADRQQYQKVSLQPERGNIVDRSGESLGLTVEASSISMRPAQFHASPEAVRTLATVLDLKPSVLTGKSEQSASFVWLKRRVSPAEETAIERLGLPGIGAELSTRRVYPHGDLASTILGFTGVDGNGLEGLERRYDAELQGEAGAVVVERDAHGRRMLTEGVWRPLPRHGARLELTIDAALQHVAEMELERGVAEAQAKGGLAMAMDPNTGEILALAQVPRFNPNDPDPKRPALWRDRAVTDSFEPGSTLKAVVASAAIQDGVVQPGDRLFCEDGHYRVGRRTIRDHEPYDWLTFAEAVEYSSNICLGKVGERLGRERLGAALRDFGLGNLTGVDLPGEVPGIFRPIDKWGRINVVTTSFGQGISVTLVQLTRAFAAIANGGRLMRPYVVKRVVAYDGRVLKANSPHVDARPISATTAHTVTSMLELVVEGGTGTKAQIEGLRVAGKTGTAQKVDPATGRYSARDRTASFVGYAPAENPRIVVSVVIDTPRTSHYGGTVAAPVFRRIAEHALEAMGVNREIPAPHPDVVPPLAPAQPVSIAFNPAVNGVPNLIGLGMREAVSTAARSGLRVSVDGWGAVIEQSPPPGSDLEVGSTVHLKFGSALQ